MRATRHGLVWAWLGSTNWRERAAIAFAFVVVLVGLAAAGLQGRNVGTNVWRPGWICGQTITRGAPFCTRDPHGGM